MGYSRPDISVLVATRNRASQLERMLSSLEKQLLGELSCELIVIDNGSEDETKSILARERSRFRITALYEEIAGKSRALNRGLDVAAGDLFVFTDDDITASPVWLRSLYEACRKYSSAAAFCGPIIPRFPPGTPEWMRTHRSAGPLFGKFAPGFDEGPLPAGTLPFGANFAVRASAIQGMRFKLDLGPSKENGAMFGEDSEFVGRFQDESREIIFVPAASVDHHLTPAKIEITSLLDRAFHLGREAVMSHRRKGPPHPPVLHGLSITQDFAQRIEMGGLINYSLGQLYQLHLMGERSLDHGWLQSLEHLNILSNLDLLGKSARLFYLSLREAHN
jgi:glucosyl-dolichyl phosphate glucuronosyltransferase